DLYGPGTGIDVYVNVNYASQRQRDPQPDRPRNRPGRKPEQAGRTIKANPGEPGRTQRKKARSHMAEKTDSISDLAQEFNITPRAIRFYEDRNLINPERIGQNRIYSARDHTRLAWILRGKRVGLSLSEI